MLNPLNLKESDEAQNIPKNNQNLKKWQKLIKVAKICDVYILQNFSGSIELFTYPNSSLKSASLVCQIDIS